MAYPKITVNTGKALAVIASDTIPIPSPNAVQLTGTTSAASSNKLVAVGSDFSNVVVGDIVYNTTDNTVATVTAIDSETILSISADIFTSPEDFIVFQAGPQFETRIESSTGCLLYVGANALNLTACDVKVKTVAGSIVTFNAFPIGRYLPVQVVQLYATGTTDTTDNNCLAIW
jgi:hypothetical protein|tara:strand:+ start:385 stop:906 length:522 start_codon:yes stop_codon:yes gene_type:complete